MEKRKDARGGKRIGAGRKTRDGSKRMVLNARVAQSTYDCIANVSKQHGVGLGLALDWIVAIHELRSEQNATQHTRCDMRQLRYGGDRGDIVAWLG